MAVKIQFNDETGTFTFPYNPNSFDDPINTNNTYFPIPYKNHHMVVSGGGNSAKTIVLSGHFSGSTRNTDYESLSKFQFSNELQRIYFSSDRYYLGMLSQCKKTHSGGRTNFVDYVATFQTVLSILFGDTERTTGTNEGNITTFITEITGQHDGVGDIVLADALGNEITIKEADLSGNTYFRYSFVKMIDSGSGLNISKFGVIEVDDNASYTSPTIVTTKTTGLLKLDATANISTVTATNTTGTLTKTFRDGYSA